MALKPRVIPEIPPETVRAAHAVFQKREHLHLSS